MDYTKLLLSTNIPVDKVIGVYSGSFSLASAATFSTVTVDHDISVPITGKVLTQMLWSIDGTTWNDQDFTLESGSTTDWFTNVTAYSTASTIKIKADNNGGPSAAPARTISYYVIAFEVD